MKCRLKMEHVSTFRFEGLEDLSNLEKFISSSRKDKPERELFAPYQINSLVKGENLRVKLFFCDNIFNPSPILIPKHSEICLDSDGLLLDVIPEDREDKYEYNCIKYSHQISDSEIQTMLWLSEMYDDYYIKRMYHTELCFSNLFIGKTFVPLPKDKDQYFIETHYGLRLLDEETFNKNYEIIRESQ